MHELPVFIVGTDGQGAREVVSDGATNQVAPVWSPDGRRLLYFDEGKLYLIDPSGGGPQPVDTGCATPCLSDAQLAFSSDGARLVFIRESDGSSAQRDLTTVATMDLASGRVVELRSTGSDGSAAPRWSPDGTQIVYFRFGEKDGGGPVPPRLDAIWLVDADGNGLRQLSPPTLAAAHPEWSPDGARILFESIDGEQQDIYTIRPDGTDVRRLTTDGASVSATWTPDGRILFVRPGGASPGWWTMNADGTDAALLIADAEVGPVAGNFSSLAGPTWQPLGGAALVPPPWKAATGVAVGPPAPTPVPTPVPALAPGFAWTGSMTTDDGGPLAESATLLGDGRVLFAGGCGTAAELYDPATGTFTPTGDMTAVRGGSAATLLLDGRVLFTGGYNCGPAGQDGIWASAELYDPATGTFSAADAQMPSWPAGPQLYPPVNRTRPSSSRSRPTPAHGGHVAGRRERAGRRVVQLGCRATASREEHAPIGEQSRRLAEGTAPSVGIEPVHAKPGASSGTGVGTGVGAGGPTATPVAAFHGGGTRAAPPTGCHVGPAVDEKSAATGPTSASAMRRAASVPSASIVHQPGEAPPGRTNRIRPSGVQVAEVETPSVVMRRTSVPSGRIV